MVNPYLVILVLFAFLQTGSANMLANGDGRQGSVGWKANGTVHGAAKTEIIGGVPCFTVRSPGSFAQVVELPPSAAGWYAAIVGRGQAERVNGTGSITGLPYLYGMVIAPGGKRFLAYWQGQQMLARPSSPGEWVAMSGVFRVPEGASAVSVQLQQAERKGDPQDGSAARFTDVRMVLFPTEDAARAYVAAYKSSLEVLEAMATQYGAQVQRTVDPSGSAQTRTPR